jgi:hypothetical protein
MLLMAGTCPYGSLMAMGACSKHGGQALRDRTGPHCAGLIIGFGSLYLSL